MFKRFINRLFHRPAKVSFTEARASIAVLHRELVYIQELQTARLQGKDAIIRFCAKYPRAFYETIQELESSDTLPEEMLASMARQINDAIAALQTSSMELLEL